MNNGMAQKKEIIPPINGWEENRYYIVDVCFSSGNPIHRSIFYTGFLNGNKEGTKPGGYNYISNSGYEKNQEIREVYYLKALFILPDKYIAEEEATAYGYNCTEKHQRKCQQRFMFINCGFNRKPYKDEKSSRIIHENVHNIKVYGIWGKTSSTEIRRQLMKHKPEGFGWNLTGYALIKE